MVSDRLGRHMFVGLRILQHRGGMNAGLGHERTFADIGRVTVRRAIEHVIERPRNLHQGRHLVRRHADLEAIGKFALQPQRRDQRTQIGVAAAFAEPVQRALDLASARTHRGQRIGHRLLGVVMGVDADVIARNLLHHLSDDGLDLMRHGAAIGVAQHHPARAGIVSRLRTSQREFRIFLVAVEEMLAVEHHFAAGLLRRLHAVTDRGKIFLVGGLERHAHLIGRRLRDKTDRVRFGFQERRQTRIVRGRAAGTPRHAERREAGVVELRLRCKEFGIGGIGTGIAAFDVVDAEFVEHPGDKLLVMQREIDAVGLRAVAQSGVEQIEAFASHVGTPGVAPWTSVFCIVVLASHSPLTVTVLRCLAT